MAALSLELGNDFAALGPASEQLRAFLDEAGAPEAAAYLADLVLEELVTNVIKYGYDDDAAHRIHVTITFEDHRLDLEVRDDGHAFDPLQQAAPDTTLPAEEREIGGLGIYLLRHMSDSVSYERTAGWNIVRASKDFR